MKKDGNNTKKTATPETTSEKFLEVREEILTAASEKDLTRENIQTVISYNANDSEEMDYLVIVGAEDNWEEIEDNITRKEEVLFEHDFLHVLANSAEARFIGDKTLANFFEKLNPNVIEPVIYGQALSGKSYFKTLKAHAVEVQKKLVTCLIEESGVEMENVKTVMGYRNNAETNFLVIVSNEKDYQGSHYSIGDFHDGSRVTTIGNTTVNLFIEESNPLVVQPIENSFVIQNRDHLWELRSMINEVQEEAKLMPVPA